jgi:DNA polymerase-3 subunit alpha
MLRPEELPIHKALTMIGKSEDDSDISVYEHCFFKNVDEMLDGGMPPEALENAYRISQICNVELELGGIKLPKFPVPTGYDPNSYLKKLTDDAFFDFMLSNDINIDEYQARLEEELQVIFSKGFSPYFLIVWDYIDFARKNGILVGPGRGSAGGSLVAYLLKITNIDPIKYDLLFERFLDPSRKDMPDVDCA